MRRQRSGPPDLDQFDWWMDRNCEPVIDVKPPGYFEQWRKAKLSTVIAAIFPVGYVLPWTILIGGIVALAAWDWLTGDCGKAIAGVS
jgi:hypothetical protein